VLFNEWGAENTTRKNKIKWKFGGSAQKKGRFPISAEKNTGDAVTTKRRGKKRVRPPGV